MTVPTNGIVLFKGAGSPLSNMYPCIASDDVANSRPLVAFGGITFASLEHAYQYRQAMHYQRYQNGFFDKVDRQAQIIFVDEYGNGSPAEVVTRRLAMSDINLMCDGEYGFNQKGRNPVELLDTQRHRLQTASSTSNHHPILDSSIRRLSTPRLIHYSTRLHSTRLDSTRLDSTRLDSTRLDSTRLLDCSTARSIDSGDAKRPTARLDSTVATPNALPLDSTVATPNALRNNHPATHTRCITSVDTHRVKVATQCR